MSKQELTRLYKLATARMKLMEFCFREACSHVRELRKHMKELDRLYKAESLELESHGDLLDEIEGDGDGTD